MQCCLDLPEPTLHKKITYAMLAPQSTNNFAQKDNLQFYLDLSGPTQHSIRRNYLWNVCPRLRDNSYGGNNLYNVVSTMMGQHWIGILSSQSCPNTSETLLHEKIACAMLALCKKLVFSSMPGGLFLTGSIITKQSWLFWFSVDSGSFRVCGTTMNRGQHWL